jgi:hypothetical protein
MSAEEKVDFFLQCQRLLVEFHPTSPFVCRQNNLKSRLSQMHSFVHNYKGYCHMDDNLCVLFNYVVVADKRDPVQIIKNNMYKEPDPNYNAVVIDFVVFRDLKDCQLFVQSYYDPRIQYVLFVKNNKVKLYNVVNFLGQIFNMPVV